MNTRILLSLVLLGPALSRAFAAGEWNAPAPQVSAHTAPNQADLPASCLDIPLKESTTVGDRPMAMGNTVEPRGYGDAPGLGSSPFTQLVGRRRLSPEWITDGALRAYWGFPGLEDYSHYLPGTVGLGSRSAFEPGEERGYGGNWYLNLGLQYRPRKDLILRLDGYYLLDLLDGDLNARNYYAFSGDYPSHAPFLAVWVIYQF